MKFARGIMVLLVAWLPTVRLETEATSSTSQLACYICYSTISWKDCDSRKRTVYCPDGSDEVCVKIAATQWVNKTHTKVEYARHCSAAGFCAAKECKDEGKRCTVDCCHQDLCNMGVATIANVILIVASIVLSTNAS